MKNPKVAPKQPELDDEADEADIADEDLRPTKPRAVVNNPDDRGSDKPAILSDKSEDELKEELDRRTFADDDENTEGDTSNH